MYTKINKIQGNNTIMKNIQYKFIILISMLLCISSLDAGSKKRRGTAGAQELLIPVGAILKPVKSLIIYSQVF